VVEHLSALDGVSKLVRVMDLDVKWQTFSELSARDLHDVLRLRQMIFIVEQNCAFADADGYDIEAIHGLGRSKAGELVAVARLLTSGCKYPIPSIGRVAVAKHVRGCGYGRTMVAQALSEARLRFPNSPVHIDAQAYLERFYASFGFVRMSEPFDEDGIAHVAMRWISQA
jgi:ElaA protein